MQVVATLLLVLCHLAISHAWTCKEGPWLNNVKQIDAGLGQVVAADGYYNAYFLSGRSWQPLPSARLKHVTVGPAGIWAVSQTDIIYKLVGGEWKSVPGHLKQVDAGSNAVVGANRRDYPYCLKKSITVSYKGVGHVPWNLMPGRVKYYSCGPYGCWGVNSVNNVYVMKSVSPSTCRNSNWLRITGASLTMIEVGTDGSVFGLTTTGQVYTRVGISSTRQEGTSWTHIPMCMVMKHLTYDLGILWVTSGTNIILQCAN